MMTAYAEYTEQEWKDATVFAYGRGGMVTYALTREGDVLVDDTRGGRRLPYHVDVPEAQAPPGAANSMGKNWPERVEAAKRTLRACGWPLD
jgi:hypothetical protein